MSALYEIVKRHRYDCASMAYDWKCNCGTDNAIAELTAKDDAILIAGNLLQDIKTFLETEVKVCSGVGCEYKIGLIDSIDAFMDLHGEMLKSVQDAYTEK